MPVPANARVYYAMAPAPVTAGWSAAAYCGTTACRVARSSASVSVSRRPAPLLTRNTVLGAATGLTRLQGAEGEQVRASARPRLPHLLSQAAAVDVGQADVHQQDVPLVLLDARQLSPGPCGTTRCDCRA